MDARRSRIWRACFLGRVSLLCGLGLRRRPFRKSDSSYLAADAVDYRWILYLQVHLLFQSGTKRVLSSEKRGGDTNNRLTWQTVALH